MGAEPISKSQSQVHGWGTVFSFVIFFGSLAQWLAEILSPAVMGHASDTLSPLMLLQTILFLGVGAGLLYGLSWLLIKTSCGWNYEEGELLPEGWPAIVLSLCLTVPVVCLPPLYARLTRIPIVPQGYLRAAIFVLAASAIGHIVLYGSAVLKFIGVRNLIFPLGVPPSRARAVLSEVVYAIIHFGSIVFIYRLVVASSEGPIHAAVFLPVLTSGLVWLSSVCIFIFIYPEVITKKGSALRGILNGLMLCITLIGGMLM